jgi:SAM-dependent methyltransferase
MRPYLFDAMVTMPWHRRLMASVPSWLRGLVLRFEAQIERSIRGFARALPPATLVLDAGAGECQYAHHFAHCRYVGVDLGIGDAGWNYAHLDLVGDLARLPFRPGTFAAAVNVVVLEHTTDPGRVLTELHRVLAPGGQLLLIAPQEWAVHQVPHDYFRFTRYGLRLLLERAGFTDLRITPVGGFFTLLGRRLLDSALFFTVGWRWLLLPAVAVLAGPPGVLLPFLDWLDRERLTTLGYVAHARKSAAP